MGLWNFLCGFAVFNTVCDLLFGKPTPAPLPPTDHADAGIDESIDRQINTLREHIHYLERDLNNYDPLSASHEDLRNRIDLLRNELDDLEFDRDLYDDHDDW